MPRCLSSARLNHGRAARVVYALLHLGALPFVSRGGVLYDSGGFEPPRFVSGANLEGQDAPPAGGGPWVKDSGTSTAIVQTGAVAGGLQGVQVTRVANAAGDTRWAVTKPFTPNATENRISIEFDMRVEQSGFTFGPAFGIEAYDGSNPGSLLLIGSVTVDAGTGDVLYQQAGTGFLVETGTILPRGAFHRFALSANFTDKTYSVFVNGVLLRTEGFVDNAAASFSDAPLSTFAATPDTVNTATGTAYFDNYSIASIPEPMAAGFLLSAAVVFATARRRNWRN